MAVTIGSLLIRLGLDSGEFKSGLNQSERQLRQSVRAIQRQGQELAGLGRNLSLAVTLPMIAIGQRAVAGFVEQERAMAGVEAALASMGNASGRSADQLARAADALEMRSLFDAEVILQQVTQQLLTFGNIAGREFDRAQQAAVDMATRLGGEPQAAALMLGKALNDPIRGIAALGRAGVQFSTDQRAMIASLVETGRVADAQRLILDELGKQFGGAAQAAADATPWRKAQVAIGQAMDKIGEAILPVIEPVANAIVRVANAFTALSPTMQQVVLIGGGLAAVFGPMLIGIGALVSAMAPFLSVLSAIAGSGGLLLAAKAAFVGLGAALAPIAVPLAAVAAAGALIYANWDKIAPVLQALGAKFNEVLGPKIQELVATVSARLTELWNGPLGQAIRVVMDLLVEFGAIYTSVVGDLLVRVISATVDLLSGAFSVITDLFAGTIALLTGDWQGAWDAAGRIVTTVFTTLMNAAESILPGITAAVRGVYEGVREWMGQKLLDFMNGVIDKVRQVEGAFAWMYDRVVGNSWVPDMVAEIGTEMSRLDQLMVQPATAATRAVDEAMQEMARKARAVLDRLFPEAAARLRYAADRESLSALPEGLRGAAQRALANEEDLRRNADRPAIDIGADVIVPDMERVQESLKALTASAQVNTVRIAESFKDMATSTLNALGSMVSAIKGGGFFDILQSVVGVGLQLGSIGAFGSSIAGRINAVPGFANGTNFAPGGLALVGERGPELVDLPRGSRVTPNHALGRSGGNTYNLTGNLMTPEFWAMIQRGDAAAAERGAASGMGRMAYAQSRRVG